MLAEPAADGEPIRHKVDLETVEGWWRYNMGRSPHGELTAADWLTVVRGQLSVKPSVVSSPRSVVQASQP